jgi:hypothetical protein
MVKQQDISTAKAQGCKGVAKPRRRANKINASTAYDTCREQLSPFGGLLALVKFLDLIQCKQLVDEHYRPRGVVRCWATGACWPGS